MYKAERRAALPPQTERLPRNAPLSRLSGATPARAPAWPLFTLPSSRRCVSNVEESTGPTPGALRIRSSWARHMGDERISSAMSLSRSSTCCLSQRMCSSIWSCTRLGARLRRFRSEVAIPNSCRRRSTSARSSRVSSSGRGRTGGLTASANCASTWASMASVLASQPVARAKLRTCRGFTNDTGRPTNSNSPATSVSNPPVASNTTPDGLRGTIWSTIEAMPLGSLAYCLASPVGRIATSNSLADTSIPTYTSPRLGITTPPVWGLMCSLLRPSLATFDLDLSGPTTVRALGAQGRDDPAGARSIIDQDSNDLPRPQSTYKILRLDGSRMTVWLTFRSENVHTGLTTRRES